MGAKAVYSYTYKKGGNVGEKGKAFSGFRVPNKGSEPVFLAFKNNSLIPSAMILFKCFVCLNQLR